MCNARKLFNDICRLPESKTHLAAKKTHLAAKNTEKVIQKLVFMSFS